MALTSNELAVRSAMRGLIGEPMAAPWICSYYLPWKRKYVFLQQNSSRVIILGIDIEVLLGSKGSYL